jgi:hypothetical protein
LHQPLWVLPLSRNHVGIGLTHWNEGEKRKKKVYSFFVT